MSNKCILRASECIEKFKTKEGNNWNLKIEISHRCVCKESFLYMVVEFVTFSPKWKSKAALLLSQKIR